MKKIFLVFIFSLVLFSCNEYQKAYKSEDVAFKYEVAEKLFNQGKFGKAIRIFEQIAVQYKGKPQAEKMYYMYATSYFKTKQYYLAGYQYENFTASYPKSEKAEECAFYGAYCYSKLSPEYSLDQVDTYKAIEKLQTFIDKYPNSSFLTEANLIAKELRTKLEKKSFEIAKQYHTISDYKSALVTLENFISDFPGTQYKEDALYYKFDSEYQLAINSISSKMKERLELAKEYYDRLIRLFPETKYKEISASKLELIDKELQQLSK